MGLPSTRVSGRMRVGIKPGPLPAQNRPLIPVVILLTARGLLVCLRRALPSLTERRCLGVVAFAAAVVALSATASQWTPVRPSGLASNVDARALFSAIRPLAATSGTAVLSFKPHVLTLETGVAAMSIFGAPPERTVREFCEKGISHVVVGDMGLFPLETALLRATIASLPATFREEYRNASFSLWRFADDVQRRSDPQSCPERVRGSAWLND